MNIQKDWKAKLESAYSYTLKYSKITVCIIKQFLAHLKKSSKNDTVIFVTKTLFKKGQIINSKSVF